MKGVLARLRALASALYNFAGDRRTKNCLLVLLAVMTAFGMVAPDRATSIRDTLLSLAL
jgi:hypothetical protein